MLLIVLILLGVIGFLMFQGLQARRELKMAAHMYDLVAEGQRRELNPRKPDMVAAAVAFAGIYSVRMLDESADLDAISLEHTRRITREGASAEAALSARWGGINAIHADVEAVRHCLGPARAQLGLQAGSEDDSPKDWLVKGALVYLTSLIVTTPNEFERFLSYAEG